MNVRIGTRPSRLALRQVDEIKKRLPHMRFDIIPIETEGDKDKKTPLTGQMQDDFFTHEIPNLFTHQQEVTVLSSVIYLSGLNRINTIGL